MAVTIRKSGDVKLSRAGLLHPELKVSQSESQNPENPNIGPRSRIPRQIENWIERARFLGLQNRQLVWDLHVCQGLNKTETARLLGISVPRVWQLYEEGKLEIAARAPLSPDDFRAAREEVRDIIMAAYHLACRPIRVVTTEIDVETGKEVKVEDWVENTDPRNIALRLKAAEQLAKLHGLNLEQSSPGAGALPYATPDEVVARVRAAVLVQHGRYQDIEEAVRALMPADSCEQKPVGGGVGSE